MRRNVKFIAVTIDDGPNQHGTVRYLQLAKKYDIAFTFFGLVCCHLKLLVG